MSRIGRVPKTLYYVEYTCGHWEIHHYADESRKACPTCKVDLPANDPGQPWRITRYHPHFKGWNETLWKTAVSTMR